jgi:hypothetical protein
MRADLVEAINRAFQGLDDLEFRAVREQITVKSSPRIQAARDQLVLLAVELGLPVKQHPDPIRSGT